MNKIIPPHIISGKLFGYNQRNRAIKITYFLALFFKANIGEAFRNRYGHIYETGGHRLSSGSSKTLFGTWTLKGCEEPKYM